MRILLTNDDGIHSKGIKSLYYELATIADVAVVAPVSEYSAAGHSITIANPLRVIEIKDNGVFFGFAVTGTPADCVKIAIKAILEQPPDIVVSGINRGANIATNIIYSGTVSAATEGAILGFPSIAVSLATFKQPDYSVATYFMKRLATMVYEKGLPKGTSLNVNIPAVPLEEIKGVIVTKQGISRFIEEFDKRIDPRDNVYYWQAGEMKLVEEDSNADGGAIENNFISITPLHYDLTNYSAMDIIKGWNISI